MSKPNTLKDLLSEGHISLGEVRKIAADIFNGTTTAAGPEGYMITACSFDALPEHVKGFVVKAILEFSVENVLDAAEDEGPLVMHEEEFDPEELDRRTDEDYDDES